MQIPLFDKRKPITPEQQAEHLAWFDATRREADRVNAEAQLAAQQIKQAEFEANLISATGLELRQLEGIKNWLKHNP